MIKVLDQLESLARKLSELKGARELQKEWIDRASFVQGDVIPVMREIDPTDREGFVFSHKGKRFRAKVQQNRAPTEYDIEKLVHALKRKGLWDRVSSEMLDIDKLEKEIKNGNVSRSLIRKCTIVGNRPAPYVRFDEVKRRGKK